MNGSELLMPAREWLLRTLEGMGSWWHVGRTLAIALAILWLVRRLDRWLGASRWVGGHLRRVVEPKLQDYRSSVLASRAEKAGDWLQAGLLYEQRGLLYRALDCYERAEEYHLCAEICLRLGRKDYAAEWLLLGGESRRAARLFEELGQFERAAEIHLEIGSSLDAAAAFARAGRHQKAAELYRRSGNTLKAAEAFESAGAFAEAGECFERHVGETGNGQGGHLAASQRAELARLSMRAAQCYERAQMSERAVSVLEAGDQLAMAASLAEKRGDFRRAAELYQRTGQVSRAAELYARIGDTRKASELEGESRLSSGDAEAAAEAFLRGSDPLRAAELFESAGRFDRASQCYEQMEAFGQAAEAGLRAGEQNRAANLFEKAKQFDHAAEIYVQIGEFPRAAKLFAQAERFFDAAKAAAEANDEKRMVDYLQRVPPEDAHYHAAVVELARTFIRRGWSSLAVEKLTSVLGDHPVQSDTLELWDALARAHEAQGELQKAKDLLHKIMAVQVNYQDASQRHSRLVEKLAEETRVETVASTPGSQSSTELSSTLNGDRYRLDAMLGKGGMGAVYKAYDRLLKRPVAYKVIGTRFARNPQARDQLLNEARSAAALNHPNIITVFDVGLKDGEAFICMELVEGETYASLVRKKGRLDFPEVAHFLVSACQGLGHAHGRGIVHHDFKPSNVLLTVEKRVKIVDFGLARTMEPSDGNGEASLSGTPKYVAPEQVRGEPTDARSDLYSLGATLYELLVGHPPFTEGNLIMHHLYTPPPPLRSKRSEIPPAWEQLVLQCLAKKPPDRFQSAHAVLTFATDAGLL